ATIELHHQLGFEAREVHDVGTDRLLSPELVALQARRAHMCPKQSLGIGGILAQVLCMLAELHHRFLGSNDIRKITPPLPDPLPRGGRGAVVCSDRRSPASRPES